MKKYKYFLFDLDGTVTDSKEGVTKSAAYALEGFGIKVNSTDALTYFIGPPLTYTFKTFHGFTDEEADKAVVKFREYYSEKGVFENTIYKGLEDTFKLIKNNGGKLVMATSKAEVFAEIILKTSGLYEYFDFISASSYDTSRINKSDIIKYAIEQLDIKASEALMIGDTHFDIEGAKDNNIDSLGVLYGYGSLDELTDAGATWIAKDAAALKELISEAL